MADLLRAPNGPEALRTLFRYITSVADDAIATTLAQAIPAGTPDVKEAFMTLAEKWLAKGEAKGKAEGKAEALRKLLTLKFGDLPDAALTRLSNATLPDLDRWLDRVLAAAKLQDVLDY